MNGLEADDERYAALEVEALAAVHPWPDDEAAFAHTEFVAHSFCRRGYPLLLVTATIVDAHYLRRLIAALPSDEILLVRLEAPPDVLRERLTRREPPDWVGLPRLLEAADGLAGSMAQLPGVDLVLGTIDAQPSEVAAAIRDALRGL
jgi:hypothetical protein